MFSLKETIHRRSFLGSLAATTALGLTAISDPLRAFADEKHKPGKSTNAQFDAWLGRIKGKHRQVFDAPSPNHGYPLAWARVFYMTNVQVGAAEKDCCAVVVLRHDAIPMAMNDGLWTKYKFGEAFKVTDGATKSPALRNPFYKPNEGELPLQGMSLDKLVETGVIFGVCDMALTVYSKHFGEQMKMSGDDIKSDWVSGILPGVTIIPSGVLAINRAQELGCSYCYAGEG